MTNVVIVAAGRTAMPTSYPSYRRYRRVTSEGRAVMRIRYFCRTVRDRTRTMPSWFIASEW